MKRYKWSSSEEIANLNQIEICPKAMELTQTIAERISSDGGGALIIDYGLNGVVSDSLQVREIAIVSRESSFTIDDYTAKQTLMVAVRNVYYLSGGFIFVKYTYALINLKRFDTLWTFAGNSKTQIR